MTKTYSELVYRCVISNHHLHPLIYKILRDATMCFLFNSLIDLVGRFRSEADSSTSGSIQQPFLRILFAGSKRDCFSHFWRDVPDRLRLLGLSFDFHWAVSLCLSLVGGFGLGIFWFLMAIREMEKSEEQNGFGLE